MRGRKTPFQCAVEREIQPCEFLFLYGPSGAGKTTLLRLLAGLDKPDRGRICVGDQIWFDDRRRIFVPPQQREVGMVFQDFALFPHLSVYKNLQFALNKGGPSGLVDELLDLMDLTALVNQKPDQLSGGQKQRVALARALVRQPKLLLLDEPLSALDDAMRVRLQTYLKQLHQQYGLTTVMVSHSLPEVLHLGSQVWKMDQGRITAGGSPLEIFVPHPMSGKVQLTGQVLSCEKADLMVALVVIVGEHMLRLEISETEAEGVEVGETVLVTIHDHAPMVTRIG